MSELPILFSRDMSRAILDGGKMQTRRVVKPQPSVSEHGNLTGEWLRRPLDGLLLPKLQDIIIHCPYGQSGDQLWVKETHAAFGRWETRFSQKKKRDEWHFVDMTLECGLEYRFDFGGWPSGGRGAIPGWHVRPSIFMPRVASRIALEVTGVRVELLQEISEEDAIAEGVESIDFEREERDWSICPKCGGTRLHEALGPNGGVMFDVDCRECDTHVKRYRHLWDSLNAARGYGWDANPWVWVVEFKRISA